MLLMLRISIVLLLGWTAAAQDCPDDGLFDTEEKCTSCSHYVTCNNGDSTPTPCATGTACVEGTNADAVCVPVSSVPDCECESNQVFTCDPYDESLVELCATGDAPHPYLTCSTGEVCKEGECTGLPDDQCPVGLPDPAFIAYKPDCTTGLTCVDGFAVNSVTCDDGQYFDPSSIGCKSFPLNNCEEIEAGLAPCQTDCSKGVVCEDGVEQIEFPCGSGQKFDTVSNSCVDESVAVCADLDGCIFPTTTTTATSTTVPTTTTSTTVPTTTTSTTVPTTTTSTTITTTTTSTPMPPCTADNANKRYPDEEDCKSYYVCRQTSDGTYSYIHQECTADLVYNPVTTYCDQPENVPGCSV